LAAASVASRADAAAPRPLAATATAVAVAEIIRFEHAAPDPGQTTGVLQRQVDNDRREIAFF
jgi:hypothetical protein